nr:helix-turn-helix transcriptional regulator [Paraferrimonas haliotis]
MIKHINDSRYHDLVKWLKSARVAQGLSVRDLGQLINEPHQFVVKVETHERKLNVFEYVQYCEALKVDPSVGLAKLSTSSKI